MNYQQVYNFTGHTEHVTCLSISPGGDWLASGDTIGQLRIWELDSGRRIYTHSFKEVITTLLWHPKNRNRLFVGGTKGMLQFFDDFQVRTLCDMLPLPKLTQSRLPDMG